VPETDAGFGQGHVHDVAEGLLRVIGDADPDAA
jgi:hypothetical protein